MTGLIWAPSIAPSVFVLTEFDWINVFVARVYPSVGRLFE